MRTEHSNWVGEIFNSWVGTKDSEGGERGRGESLGGWEPFQPGRQGAGDLGLLRELGRADPASW